MVELWSPRALSEVIGSEWPTGLFMGVHDFMYVILGQSLLLTEYT